VRVWSAGCASGEEAYTTAMVLAESLGVEQFRQRVKIYATDVDEESLAYARHASYGEHEVSGLPTELRDRYFESHGDRYLFHPYLRRSIIFGRNDLVQDAPISRVDVLVCRNTLMYFNPEAQTRILSRFHFALASGGVLFLGRAEMLLSHRGLFTPVDINQRLFRKVPTVNAAIAAPSPPAPQPVRDHAAADRLRADVFAASPVPQIVLNEDGLVTLTNRQAETLFSLSTKDIGRPFRDLELSRRHADILGYVEQAQRERLVIRVTDVEYVAPRGEIRHLELHVNPVVDNESGLLGVALVFMDLTAQRRLRDELEFANRQLGTAYEELQASNDELETTNEELQSTVEELETTNEELQSTNEALDTMNEELRSTNDEMRVVNNELHSRTADADDANAFVETVLTSLGAGVAVVDRDLYVRIWNRRAVDLWGLQQDEVVGKHFLTLDIGMPTDQLRRMILGVLHGATLGQPTQVSAVNQRGRTVEIRVVGTPSGRNNDGIAGAMLLMDATDLPPEQPMARST
jgi:two-component system, chemotaxis family, CheB/CheR fusion protein